MPIILVLSLTETNIIFAIPKPPTSIEKPPIIHPTIFIILKISSKGHIPILSNKFKKYIVDEKLVNQIDYELLQTCDAIYFINLNKEDINIFEMIINKGIQVFANFEEIPEKRAKNTQLL